MNALPAITQRYFPTLQAEIQRNNNLIGYTCITPDGVHVLVAGNTWRACSRCTRRNTDMLFQILSNMKLNKDYRVEQTKTLRLSTGDDV